MIRPVDGGEKYDAAIVDFVGHPPSLVTSIREHMRSETEPTAVVDVGESAVLAIKKIFDRA